jgi:hypothetical protein
MSRSISSYKGFLFSKKKQDKGTRKRETLCGVHVSVLVADLFVSLLGQEVVLSFRFIVHPVHLCYHKASLQN